MAPLPVIDGVYRVAFNWLYSDQPALRATNVMHFGQDGGSAATLAAAIDAHVTAAMWTHTATHAHVDNLVVTPLDGTSTQFVLATGSPAKWSGSHTSQSIMPQVAALVKLTTAVRGRSHRGRAFLPWVAEDAFTDGQLATADRTAMQTAWDAFHAAMHTAGDELVVASYKLAEADLVTGVLVERYAATVRRRNKRNSS